MRTAYHSFQAAAGMFTYINENFLHAPSTDLSRDCVKTLIHIMLAQAQEVFLEKQIADGKKSGMLAKLASQAALLYSQAVDGCQENVAKSVFDKTWTTLCLVCFPGVRGMDAGMMDADSWIIDKTIVHGFPCSVPPGTCRLG